MKKLFTLVFALGCLAAAAQYSKPQNSLAIVAGPNWTQHINNGIDGGPAFDARTGYSFGLDYALDLSAHWQLKAGFRYCEFNSVTTVGPLTWPSEFSTGQYVYDPSLPHYITAEYRDKALQYFVGMRLLSKPGAWRVYADADMGMTDVLEPEGTPKGKVKLTLGAGLGLAWQPAKGNISLFAQPVLRYVFENFGSDLYEGPGYRLLIPGIEAGAGYHF